MNQNTGRSSLLAIAGGYLVYLAYEMLKNLIDEVPTTMPRWLAILVITGFTGIGITLVIYAWKLWKKGKEDQDSNPVELEQKEKEKTSEQNNSGE